MPHILLAHYARHETPFPLGRHIEKDSRSHSFAIAVPPTGVAQRSVTWANHAPVLNQLKVSSCVGNAMAQLLNCAMFANSRVAAKKTSAWLTEADALAIYSLATHCDGFGSDQFYPPNDDGSTGLGVAKAAQQAGYIDTYAHAFTMPQLQAALAVGPVIAGTPWLNSMFTPDPVTAILPVGPVNDSTIAGGHEYFIPGIDYQLRCFIMQNSWGPNWGGGDGLAPGQARIKFDDFENLLAADGDIIAPLPKLAAA